MPNFSRTVTSGQPANRTARLAGGAALVLLGAMTSPLTAANWTAGEGDWNTPGNWDTLAVPNGVQVNINNGGTATIDSAATPSPSSVALGLGYPTDIGSLIITGAGALTTTGTVSVGVGGGTGTLTVEDGGTLNVGSTGNLAFNLGVGGNVPGGTGTLYLSGAGSSVTFGSGTFGTRGVTGHVIQTGGTLTTTGVNVDLNLGQSDHNTIGNGDASGYYTLSGGTVNLASALILGNPNRQANAAGNTEVAGDEWGDAYGQFTQTGGSVTVGTGLTSPAVQARGFVLGNYNTFGARAGTATGLYQLYGGSLTLKADIVLGRQQNDHVSLATPGYGGSGTFEFGNADGTGTLTQLGGLEDVARHVVVRANKYSDGTFVGHGDVQFTGTLTNNGQVIADGYGIDRTLNMGHFTTVTRTVLDADLTSLTGAVAGWYARNGGELVLPTIALTAGNQTVRWGENSSLGLVNSVQVSFANNTDGNLDIALLAADRAEVKGAPPAVAFIGVWDVEANAGLTFNSATLQVHYDAARAAELGLTEDDLKFYHFTGGNWVDVTGALDTAGNLITSNAVGSFSQFAVGAAVPEPASLGILGVGGLMLLARRRR